MKQFLHEIRLGIKDFEGRMSKAGVLQGRVRKQMAAGWNEAIGTTNVQAYVIRSDISHLFPTELIENAEKTATATAGE
jgi:hypothetical protein